MRRGTFATFYFLCGAPLSATYAVSSYFSDAARHRLRDAAGDALSFLRLTSPARFAYGALSIVTFHRVLPDNLKAVYPMPGLAVTPEELDFIVGTIAEHYTPGPLGELTARHLAGERPRKPFMAITFDDGQRDNLDFGVPVLRAHGVSATFFVVADAAETNQPLWHDRVGFAFARLDDDTRRALDVTPLNLSAGAAHTLTDVTQALKTVRPAVREAFIDDLEGRAPPHERPAWDGFMTWQELRALQGQGHEIGSHTRSHPILTLSTESELADEIGASRQILEQQLAGPVVSFCYPNGDHDGRVVEAARRAGYSYAVTTLAGRNSASADQFALRRTDMQGRFARRADGSFSSAPLLLRLGGFLGRG